MSAFTRTAAGISNYASFHGAEIVVYIEGRRDGMDLAGPSPAGARLTVPVDEIYFGSILTAASNGRRLKIKCVGSKSAVLEYASKIERDDIKNSIVVVDKDLDGVISSPINESCVIRTFGYSWENELWSEYTLKTLLGQLTNIDAIAEKQLIDSLSMMTRRMGYLSALDAAAQTSGVSILKKSSSLCGVGFDFTSLSTLSASEVKRVSAKYRVTAASNCPIATSVYKRAMSLEPREVIQGHFWENAATKLVSYIYRKKTRDSMPSTRILLNLALAIARNEPERCLGEVVFSRYQTEFARALA